MEPVKSDRISEPAQVQSVYLDRMTSSRQESDAVLERLLIGSSAGHTHTHIHTCAYYGEDGVRVPPQLAVLGAFMQMSSFPNAVPYRVIRYRITIFISYQIAKFFYSIR